MAGLRANIPWEVLLEMQLPRLVMMLEAAHPSSNGAGRASGGPEVRSATQADIDKFLA